MSNEALGWVFKNSPYTGSKLVIHLAVADVVNDMHNNEFWMSNEKLATKANCTRATVNGALAEMVQDGYLAVVAHPDGRSKTVKYRFLFKSVKNADTSERADQKVSNFVTHNDESVKNADTLGPESVKNADTIPIVITQDKDNPISPLSLFETKADWQTVWEEYVSVCDQQGLSKKKLTHSRQQLIQRRLKDWSVDQLVQAMRGLGCSPWHLGDNPNNKVYDSIELILRSAETVERFIAASQKPPVTNTRKHVNEAWGEPTTGRKVITND